MAHLCKLSMEEFNTQHFNDHDYSKVTGWLYISGSGLPSDIHAMLKLRIVTVVNCTRTCPNFHTDRFVHLRLNLSDTSFETISEYLDSTFSMIEAARQAGGACLVHCSAGQSRSVALVIAYLMRSKGWCLARALAYMQSCRPSSSPNPGFMAQLLSYEHNLFKCTSIDLDLYSSDRFARAEELITFSGAITKLATTLPSLPNVEIPAVTLLCKKLRSPRTITIYDSDEFSGFSPCSTRSGQGSLSLKHDAFFSKNFPQSIQDIWASDY